MPLPSAHVVHAIPGRIRLRMAERHTAPRLLAQLGQAAQAHPFVREVRTSARTGTMLLLYEGELEDVLRHILETGLVRLVEPTPHTPMQRLRRALEAADDRVSRETEGALSLGTATFFAYVAAGLWQLRRGDFMPAGLALFNTALGIMEREAEREVSHAKGRSAPRTRT